MFPGFIHTVQERDSNLLRAAKERLGQAMLQITPQDLVKCDPEQQEDPGQQTGIPDYQPKAEGSRIHVSVSSLME
jgi:hypothetical protein